MMSVSHNLCKYETVDKKVEFVYKMAFFSKFALSRLLKMHFLKCSIPPYSHSPF